MNQYYKKRKQGYNIKKNEQLRQEIVEYIAGIIKEFGYFANRQTGVYNTIEHMILSRIYRKYGTSHEELVEKVKKMTVDVESDLKTTYRWFKPTNDEAELCTIYLADTVEIHENKTNVTA